MPQSQTAIGGIRSLSPCACRRARRAASSGSGSCVSTTNSLKKFLLREFRHGTGSFCWEFHARPPYAPSFGGRNRKFCPVRLGGGGGSRAGGRAGGQVGGGTLLCSIASMARVLPPCGRAWECGRACGRACGCRHKGEGGCVVHGPAGAFLWAAAANRQHPPRPPPAPDIHPRISTFNGTSVVTFNPAPGTFMPARQKVI